MTDERLEFIGSLTAFLEPPQVIANNPHGTRMIFMVRTGTVEGSGLRGDVLPGGGDWFLMRSDGVGELDVRVTIRTEDGEHILVSYKGIMITTQEAIAHWSAGEAVDPSEAYFRTSAMFETGAEKYAWLNRIVAVGFGQLTAGGGVCYQLYKVL